MLYNRLRFFAVALPLVLVAGLAIAQVQPGQSPLSLSKGGTGASNAVAARSNLGVAIGSDVQAYDPELVALAGLISASNKCFYWTGTATAATFDCTSFGRGLINAADAGAARTAIGAVIGTDVQAYDAELAALAANSTSGLWAHTGAGTGAARTLMSPAAGFTITNPAGTSGDPTFVLANDLAALEALASTGYGARTATDTWAQRIFQSGSGLSVTNGDGVTGNTSYAISDAELLALAGLTSAADKCNYWTGSGTAATFDCLAWARAFVSAANAAAGRTALGIAIGSDVQAYDPELVALAGLTSASNKCFYWTGTATAATFDCTSFGRGLINAADAGAARTAIGAVIGTDVQAYDAELAALAANSTSGLWAHTGVGTGAARIVTGTAGEIAVSNGDGVSGNPTISLPNSLDFTGKTVTDGAFNGGTIDDAVIGGTTPKSVNGTIVTATQKIRMDNAVTSTQITSDQNNYTGTDGSNTCSTKKTIRISSDAVRDITGLSCSQADGDLVSIYNKGSFTITLKDESSSSTAANRFGFGADLSLGSKQGALLQYDGTDLRFRQIGGPSSAGGGGGTVSGITAGEGLRADGTAGGTITTSGTLSQDLTIPQLMMQVAKNSAATLFFGDTGNRFADSFDALTYVDTGAATNLNTSTAGALKPTGGTQNLISQATGTAIGNMTSSGGLAAAFNGTKSEAALVGARSVGAVSAAYVGKDWGSGTTKTVDGIKLTGSNNLGVIINTSPTVKVTLQGSTDNFSSSVVDLGNFTFSDTSSEVVQLSGFTTSTAYRYHRVKIELNAGGTEEFAVAELEFYETTAIGNVTVSSTALTATAAPTIAKVAAQVVETDAITLNTDLIFSASRDGGSNYTAFTMTKKYTNPAGVAIYESADLDISGQPSGTSMKWRAASANNKNFELRDIYLNWR